MQQEQDQQQLALDAAEARLLHAQHQLDELSAEVARTPLGNQGTPAPGAHSSSGSQGAPQGGPFITTSWELCGPEEVDARLWTGAATSGWSVAQSVSKKSVRKYRAPWGAVFHNRAGACEAGGQVIDAPVRTGSAPVRTGGDGRWSRCNKCADCQRNDCGVCVSCLEKTRFGGKGLRSVVCKERLCQTKVWLEFGPSRQVQRYAEGCDVMQ